MSQTKQEIINDKIEQDYIHDLTVMYKCNHIWIPVNNDDLEECELCQKRRDARE